MKTKCCMMLSALQYCLIERLASRRAFLSLQKHAPMFQRMDASSLPQEILCHARSLSFLRHGAGSAL